MNFLYKYKLRLLFEEKCGEKYTLDAGVNHRKPHESNNELYYLVNAFIRVFVDTA